MPGKASPFPSPLRVLAHVHGYPPHDNAGAEYMLHMILRWLVSRGHEARVIVAPERESYEYEGVSVVSAAESLGGDHAAFFRWAERHAAWSNLILTHLDFTANAVGIARVNARPLVHLVHNEMQLGHHGVTEAALVIFNSAWVSETVAWQGPSIIVRPPVFARDYLVDRNGAGAITLVATIKLKGVDTFYEIARRMPKRRFLGVQGAYSLNIAPEPELSNVEIRANGPDIASVYRQTRILLVPSQYESWSRCAIEAATSGIPVIASPTPGLRESLGEAGIFVERDDIAGWCRRIDNLDEDRAYRTASEAVRARAAELEASSEQELEALEEALMRVAK